jgi:KDO2-lipid IV(A) lauroyltransferase
MRYWFEFFAVKILFSILSLVPLSLSGWIMKRAGDLFFYVSYKRRNTALSNLTIAYGDTLSVTQKNKIIRKCFESGALSILELFLTKEIKKDASSRFTVTGKRYFGDALSRGKGVIFVAAHFGSWEYIGFPGYLEQVPHAVIVKRIKNKYLDGMIDTLRREIDTMPIPKVNAIRQTLSELRQNHTVAVVIDQWDGSDGIWIDFFGKATSTTSLPARLAKKTGCALIPIYCLRKEIGRYEIQVRPEVPLSSGPDWEYDTTRRLNEMLESQIRQYPEQWSWGHRRWKPKPLTVRTS